jgi:methionyl-tRNA formyltransferase
MQKRIVFMGSPEFSIPSLIALIENYEVAGLVTQPDRPAGRGKVLTAPPAKTLAIAQKIPVIQPERLKDPGVFDTLAAWEPDFIVVAAFGQILRQNVLDLPKLGCINVHGSILPRWRGAAPVQAAILHGDKQTGVTIMKMDKGIDTGDILTTRSLPVEADDNSFTLSKKLAVLGAGLLVETLDRILNAEIIPQKQDDTLATYAPIIKKEDGLLVPSKSAVELERQIRAYIPWPGTFIKIDEDIMKVFEGSVMAEIACLPGQRIIADGYPVLGTKDGALKITKIQPAGRKVISGKDFLLGYKKWATT